MPTLAEANAGPNLANALADISDEYLHCRGVQHRWNVTQDMHITGVTEDGHSVEKHYECETCTCVRRDRFLLRQDRWGVNRLEVLHPTYDYPEGYLMSEMGQADHAREVVRYEMLVRALGGREKVRKAMQKVPTE